MKKSISQKLEIEIPKKYSNDDVMMDLEVMEDIKRDLFNAVKYLFEANEETEKRPLDEFLRIYELNDGPYTWEYAVHTLDTTRANFTIIRKRIKSNMEYMTWHFEEHSSTNDIRNAIRAFSNLHMLQNMTAERVDEDIPNALRIPLII